MLIFISDLYFSFLSIVFSFLKVLENRFTKDPGPEIYEPQCYKTGFQGPLDVIITGGLSYKGIE